MWEYELPKNYIFNISHNNTPIKKICEIFNHSLNSKFAALDNIVSHIIRISIYNFYLTCIFIYTYIDIILFFITPNNNRIHLLLGWPIPCGMYIATHNNTTYVLMSGEYIDMIVHWLAAYPARIKEKKKNKTRAVSLSNLTHVRVLHKPHFVCLCKFIDVAVSNLTIFFHFQLNNMLEIVVRFNILLRDRTRWPLSKKNSLFKKKTSKP